MLDIAHGHRSRSRISSSESNGVLVRSEGAEINGSCLQVVHAFVREIHSHSSSIGDLVGVDVAHDPGVIGHVPFECALRVILCRCTQSDILFLNPGQILFLFVDFPLNSVRHTNI